MDEASIRALIELNQRFYEQHAGSFSATRESGWPGWREVMRLAREAGVGSSPEGNAPLRVLDVACGNLRFERFLATEYPGMRVEAQCIDSNDELMQAGIRELESTDGRLARVYELDVLETLLASERLPVPSGCFDLAASFGFMHHVPGKQLRRTLLRDLVRSARPGGIVAVSFWQFMDDERLAAKAREAETRLASTPTCKLIAPAALDPGDHFLGWQGNEQALRYCHHFSEDEIDALARSIASKAREIARFSADGKSGGLNRYLILARL